MEVDIRDLVAINYNEDWHSKTSYEKDKIIKGYEGKHIKICAHVHDVANANGRFNIYLYDQYFKTLTFRIKYDNELEEYYSEITLSLDAFTRSEEIAKQFVGLVKTDVNIIGKIVIFIPHGYKKNIFLQIEIKKVEKADSFWMTQEFFNIPSIDPLLNEAKERVKREKLIKESEREREKDRMSSGADPTAILALIYYLVILILIIRFFSCVCN